MSPSVEKAPNPTAPLDPLETPHRVISRRTAFVAITIVALAGILGGWLLIRFTEERLSEIEHLAQGDPEEALRQFLPLFWTLIAGLMAAALGGASFAGWYGYRVLLTRRHPPSGFWILEGQTIMTGSRAARIGWLHVVLAILLTIVGIGTGIVCLEIIARLSAHPG